MTCYRPIVAFVVGYTEEGKKILKFVKDDVKRLDYYEDSNGVVHKDYEKIMIPCGKCDGCKMKRSRDWAIRLMLERQYHEKACFITLTYDDEHVPVVEMQKNSYDRLYGKTVKTRETMTLKKKDIQDFMKRLRKFYDDNFGVKIRFFACGEYGTKTLRPHYHAVLFGVDFSEDRYVHCTTKDGYIQYRSPILEKIWDYGFSMICDCNYQTCGYVARYCVKKMHAHNMDYQTLGIEPEFNTMSRRPGIAYQWYVDNFESVYPNKYIYLSTANGGKKFRPPKYFDKLLEEDYPEWFEDIAIDRKESAIRNMEKITKGGELDYFEELLSQGRDFRNRIKNLKREKVQ